MGLVSIFIFSTFIACISRSDGYDALDPNGNITIKWDVLQSNSDNYDIKVSVFNYQLFRHIEYPGWKLSWTWSGKEVIWTITGAEALEEGDCSRYTDKRPHCCLQRPHIVDLGLNAHYNMQYSNCCKGGVLSSMMQDNSKYGAAFLMNVGGLSIIRTTTNGTTNSTIGLPKKFDIGVRGYSCGDPFLVPPTRFPPRSGSHHVTQALYTWKVTCSFAETRATQVPTCCVSLSAFYNETIVGCPQCSCGCQGLPGSKCVNGTEPSLLKLPHSKRGGKEVQPIVRCTSHMCPIRVHWHVKTNYREYWRVKMTVTNQNFAKNYSQWNVVVVHPSLGRMAQIFSFNYKPLIQYGYINDTGIFYGIKYYNEMLLQAGSMGNVQTEMLLAKEPNTSTFIGGYAFPRKISFNGHDCVMPPPDEYPMLPSRANSGFSSESQSLICSLLFLITIIFRDYLL